MLDIDIPKPTSGDGLARPITCLHADTHTDENITDKLTHYLGCLEFCDRKDFYASLPPESQRGIQVELRRITFLRQVLESSQSDQRLVTYLVDSLRDWRDASKVRVEEVSRWSKTTRPRRAGAEDHDPNAEREPRRLDLKEYDPNKDTNAHMIEYVNSRGHNDTSLWPDGDEPIFKGLFPNQKISVHNLLYNDKINPISRIPPASKDHQEDRIRYYHLPANNMKWVQDIIARYYNETDPKFDTAYHKSEDRTCANTLLRRNFWMGQEHGRNTHILHTRHLRPLCELVSSDPHNVEHKPQNVVMFMPYLHWDLDHQRENFSAFIERRAAVHQEQMMAEELEHYKLRQKERRGLHPEAHERSRGPNKLLRTLTTWENPLCAPNSAGLDPRPPVEPAEAVAYRIRRERSGRFRHITPQWPRRDVHGRLLTKSGLGQLLYDAFRLFKTMGNYRDRKLIDKYLLGDPHLHPRRTLDQAYYGTLRNTRTRDRDQVVYRGTSARIGSLHHFNPDKEKADQWTCHAEEFKLWKLEHEKTPGEKRRESLRKLSNKDAWKSLSANAQKAIQRLSTRGPKLPVAEPTSESQEPEFQGHGGDGHAECLGCREAIRKVPRLVMVDQLWMWILDKNTIVTCFPKRYGANRQDSSGVHKAIRVRLGKVRSDHIRSAYDVALVIIDECSNLFFDRTKRDLRQPQVVDMFSEAIGDMAQKQTLSFDHLWHWADDLARASSKTSSSVDSSALHVALLNITPEGKLQRETKDIIDELGIMIYIAKKQREVLRRFKKHAESLLDPKGAFREGRYMPRMDVPDNKSGGETQKGEEQDLYEKWTWFRSNADDALQEADDHLEELEGLQKSAEDVCRSLDHLLSLKQQQASVVQAWQAIRQGEEAVKQGRAIMIFTVITIVFLPLAFMAAIFGMNNDALHEDKMSIKKQLKLMFTISFGVITLVIVVAFSNVVRTLAWGLICFCANYLLVQSGMYELWLSIPKKMRPANIVKRSEMKVWEMKETVRKQVRRQRAREFEREETRLVMEKKASEGGSRGDSDGAWANGANGANGTNSARSFGLDRANDWLEMSDMAARSGSRGEGGELRHMENAYMGQPPGRT